MPMCFCPRQGDWQTVTYTGAMGAQCTYQTCGECGFVTAPETAK